MNGLKLKGRIGYIYKKPSLNSYVWVYCFNSFTKVRVLAKGTEIFFHEGTLDSCKVEPFREPLRYDDYGISWFKSLKEIKQKYKIRKVEDDYYEEVEDE